MTETLTGQDIGQAAAATRAVLERLLAETGTSFQGSVILKVLADNGSAAGQDQILDRLMHGLKITEEPVLAALDELTRTGLVSRTPDGQVELTPAGGSRNRQVRDGVGRITERLYGDVPTEDLVTARRVLVAVTERANAELART
jgi:hypothetical protein